MVTFKFDLDGDAPEEIATYMVRLDGTAAHSLLLQQLASANLFLSGLVTSFLVAVEWDINENVILSLFILMWPYR